MGIELLYNRPERSHGVSINSGLASSVRMLALDRDAANRSEAINHGLPWTPILSLPPVSSTQLRVYLSADLERWVE